MRAAKKFFLLTFSILLLIALWAGWHWFSVVEEEVEFHSGELVLRGTLLSPRWSGSAPAFVMVHGSGPVTRRSMVVYAWLFALKGYATLAYDKRGVGASDGEPHEWREFSFDNLAADSVAGYRFLQAHPRIDENRIGFFGGSQGGWVVSLAATQVESPAFITMASPSVSTVAEDRVFQRSASVRHKFGNAAAKEASELIQADQLVTRAGSGYENYLRLWNAYKDRDWFNAVYGESEPAVPDSSARQWESTILDFDPQPYLRKIEAPVLWLFGDPSLDRSVPVELSIDRLASAKKAGACYRIIQVDNVGHTLEPGGDLSLLERLRIRFSLPQAIYQWLDDLGSDKACACIAERGRTKALSLALGNEE